MNSNRLMYIFLISNFRISVSTFTIGLPRVETSKYQRLLHSVRNGAIANNYCFAKHRQPTVVKFARFQEWCASVKKNEQEDLGEYADKKHTVYILNADQPAPTVSKLPDYMIHYDESRILRLREMTRLQSFSDWFQFKGKYKTGGYRRTRECSCYTQVGNAVPPLLAELIGRALLNFRKPVYATQK